MYIYINAHKHIHTQGHSTHTFQAKTHTHTIMSNTHTQPAGDGTCAYPEEYAGIGRFGCPKDCGLYKNTTKIYIKMEDFFERVKTMDRWDVSKAGPVASRPNPKFSYNIWSE